MIDFQVGDYVVCNTGNKSTIFKIIQKYSWYKIKSVCSLELGNYGKKFRSYTKTVYEREMVKVNLDMLKQHIQMVEKFIGDTYYHD